MKQPPKKVERKPTIVKGAPYESGGKIKTAKSGGAVSYGGAASAAGFTGSGSYTPSEKNVGKRVSKLKSGGQLPLLQTKPAGKNSGDAVASASKSTPSSLKPAHKNVGKRISKLKGGGSMGKCKGGC